MGCLKMFGHLARFLRAQCVGSNGLVTSQALPFVSSECYPPQVIEASEPAAVFDRFSGPSGNVGIAVTQTSAADNRLLGTGGSSDTNKDVYSMNVAAIAAGGISQGSPSSSASKVAHPVDGEHVSHKLEANHMGPPSASKHAGMKALDRPKLEARPVHPWDVAMKQTKDMTTAEAMQVAQQFRCDAASAFEQRCIITERRHAVEAEGLQTKA
eukprot:SAG31_NODE_493_length_14893_cov_20.429701_2_plen_212_part_00